MGLVVFSWVGSRFALLLLIACCVYGLRLLVLVSLWVWGCLVVGSCFLVVCDCFEILWLFLCYVDLLAVW